MVSILTAPFTCTGGNRSRLGKRLVELRPAEPGDITQEAGMIPISEV